MCNITRLCVARLIYVWHDSFMFYTTHSCKLWLPPVRLIHVFIWNMTHSYLIWLIQYDMTNLCVIWWLIHVRHDSITYNMTPFCVTYLLPVFMCDTCHPFICKATHSRMTWLPRVRRDSFTRDMTHSCVTCLIRVSLTHSYLDKGPFGIYRASIVLLLGVTLFVDTGYG